ncbi:MAG: hypothetical protein LBB41_07315 [Prevotellaceae bacterium]|jgi:hypothetical protein|nr:hypothetical protein [Prevotellaceae bacterium]
MKETTLISFLLLAFAMSVLSRNADSENVISLKNSGIVESGLNVGETDELKVDIINDYQFNIL